MNLVVCESNAAIVTHLREVTDVSPVRLGGHPFPRPLALCGAPIAWDTRLPLGSAKCRACTEKAAL